MGIDYRLGSIEAATRADLYVARSNPLDNIKAARDIRVVVKDSIAYDPAALLRCAERKKDPTSPDDHADRELEIRPLRQNQVTSVC